MNDPVYNRSHPSFIPVAEPSITAEDVTSVTLAMHRGEVALGRAVTEFEQDFAAAHDLKYACSCNSGTSALILALAALGVWEGDYVLTQAFSMVAISNAILVRRAIPLFCDSHGDSVGNVCLDDIKATVARRGIRPLAIVVQHTYGEPIKDIADIAAYCQTHGIYLVEDCAEAIYAKHNGRSVGTCGDVAIFSMYANKVITAGEGGMILSNNQSLIERATALKAHAFSHHKHFCHTEHAYGLRMPNINAALALSQHRRRKYFLDTRAKLRNFYEDWLGDLHEERRLTIPRTTAESSHWVMPILLRTEEQKDELRHALGDENVETRSYFVPMNQQEFLKRYVQPDEVFTAANHLSACGMYLPLYPSLTPDRISKICKIIKNTLA